MMSKEWFDSQSTSGQDPRVWKHFCPEGTFCRCRPNDLPDHFFSSRLLQKIDSVVVVNSGPLYMVNFNRVDGSEIKQLPFGFVFQSGSPPQSGGFIQHGDWTDRTKPAPSQFQQAIEASGIGYCQPFSGLPSITAGPISMLDPSFRAAFDKLASYLSGCLPPWTSN
jgi:hypothetical protein